MEPLPHRPSSRSGVAGCRAGGRQAVPPRSGRGGTDPATRTGDGVAGAGWRTRFVEASASRTTTFRLLSPPESRNIPLVATAGSPGPPRSSDVCSGHGLRGAPPALRLRRPSPGPAPSPRGRETPSLAATLNRRSQGSGLGRAPLHRSPREARPRRSDSTCGGMVYQYESPGSRPESQPVPPAEQRCRQPDRRTVSYGTGSGPASPASLSS